MSVKIFTTADGSHSILNETLNETYHSRHGALQESNHVFIKNGLDYSSRDKTLISILEIGFGTGLNAILTLDYARLHNKTIKYTAVEPAPLEKETWSKLNYMEFLHLNEQFVKMHEARWNEEQLIGSSFTLVKLLSKIEHLELSGASFDIVYYDAFAPTRQPELWELPVLTKVVLALKTTGTFVTYCAKGQLKRDLRSLGLQVDVVAGPPGKREMIRAIKQCDSSFEKKR